MQLTLVAPFRTNLSFDRKWISYDPSRIDDLWSTVKTRLHAQLENADLGCYLLPIGNDGRYYLDVAEPGKTYRQFYLARLRVEGKSVLAQSQGLGTLPAKRIDIEFRILDHGFALLNINLHLDVDSLREWLNTFDSLASTDRAINDFADSVFDRFKSHAEVLIGQLSSIPYINTDPTVNPLADSLLWVHKIWSVQPGERAMVKDAQTSMLISEDTLSAHLASGNDHWGWGDSIRIAEPEDERAWRDAGWLQGMCLAQYFHTCFDWIYREIPFVIEKIRLESFRGRMAKAIEMSLDFSHRAHLLIFDFTQCKLTIAGVSRISFSSLLKSWDTTALSDGIKESIPYIKELTTRADEKIKNWSQSSIELILFISAVLGLIGLSFALHDYLKPTNARFPVSGLVLPSGYSDVLFLSTLAVLFGLAVYGLAKLGVLARWASMWKLGLRTVVRHVARLIGTRKSLPR